MEKAVIKTEITSCERCPNIKTGNFYSTDGWDRMEDWFCMACDDKKIAGGVEWHDKIPIPDWCPYGLGKEKVKEEKPDLEKKTGEMVKSIKINEFEFLITIKLNHKVEKRIDGKRWHKYEYKSVGGEFSHNGIVEDSELVAKIAIIEEIITKWANENTVNGKVNDVAQKLIDLGFE